MREIEIKCRLSDKEAVKSKLKEVGVLLGEPLRQHDVVYGMPGAMDGSQGANWLRIRTENDEEVYFTLKRSVVGHLDSIEHETKVANPSELEAIIKELGFQLYSDLTKIRRKGKLGDIEICFDEVPGVGDFLEAEKIMKKDADHDRVVDELWSVFFNLGLSRDDEVYEGYDVLERRLRGL